MVAQTFRYALCVVSDAITSDIYYIYIYGVIGGADCETPGLNHCPIRRAVLRWSTLSHADGAGVDVAESF